MTSARLSQRPLCNISATGRTYFDIVPDNSLHLCKLTCM